MPPRDPKQYMRDYRARKSGSSQAELTAPERRPGLDLTGYGEKSTPVKEKRTEESTPGYHYLPGDFWVQKMTQQTRDRILDNPAINAPRRKSWSKE